MINSKELTIEELAEIASKKKLRIEINIEPNGCGQVYERAEIEPWEKYEPTRQREPPPTRPTLLASARLSKSGSLNPPSS